MKKNILLKWLLLCCFSFTTQSFMLAQSNNPEKAVKTFFKKLSKQRGAVKTEVKYSGAMSAEIAGFDWQRGEGRGWTRGTRITLPRIEAETLDSLCRLFVRLRNELSDVQQVNIYAQQGKGTTYFDSSSTFYAFSLQPDSTFCLLTAVAENEVCIPSDWATRNYYYHPSAEALRTAYFADLAPRQKRLVALSRLWEGVKRNFVFMNRTTVNWDSLYAAMIPEMEQARNDDEAARLLQRMAARLNDGHTYVYQQNWGNRVSVPLTTVLIEGRVWVDRVLSSSLQNRGVRRGMELTHINGVPVKEWAESRVMPYISSSTRQWTEHEAYDGMRLLQGKPGEKMKLQFAEGEKVLRITCKLGADKADLAQKEPDVDFRVLETNVGYLRIRTFNGYHLMGEFRKVYPDLLKTRALIIDVRDNNGGNSGNGDFLASSLVADTLMRGAWSSPKYIPAYASWGMKIDDYQAGEQPLMHNRNMEAYGKPIIVLVNRGTFSAAEDFAALLQGNRQAQLVGMPTGGSTGNGVQVSLMDGVAANICAKHDKAPGGDEFVGRGLLPDVRVDETYDSYFNRNESAVLRKALDLLLM